MAKASHSVLEWTTLGMEKRKKERREKRAVPIRPLFCLPECDWRKKLTWPATVLSNMVQTMVRKREERERREKKNSHHIGLQEIGVEEVCMFLQRQCTSHYTGEGGKKGEVKEKLRNLGPHIGFLE